MAVYLHPRLRPSAANAFLSRRDALPVAAWIGERHDLERAVYYAETGGIRAPSQQHDVVCAEVTDLAKAAGFPDAGTKSSKARFDTECSKSLYSRLRLAQSREDVHSGISGELLHGDFWTWLALYRLPEVVAWRFGANSPAERFLGGVRNCFYRLWRRAWLLEGPPDDRWSVLEALTEDALVSIVERPGICSNRTVARTIGECWFETARHAGRGRMEDVNRDAMKRINALAPVLAFEAMDVPALKELLLRQYAQALDAVTRTAARESRAEAEA